MLRLGRNGDETHLKAVEYSPRIKELALSRILVGPGEDVIGSDAHF
jgi:hypothetical protein